MTQFLETPILKENVLEQSLLSNVLQNLPRTCGLLYLAAYNLFIASLMPLALVWIFIETYSSYKRFPSKSELSKMFRAFEYGIIIMNGIFGIFMVVFAFEPFHQSYAPFPAQIFMVATNICMIVFERSPESKMLSNRVLMGIFLCVVATPLLGVILK